MKILVVGAGPAGLMAAYQAAKAGAEVILLEKNPVSGKKLLLTGGGRGNFTNISGVENLIAHTPGNGKFLYGIYQRFSGQDCQQFFSSLGVASQEEENGRIFTQKGAETLIEAFHRQFKKLGVEVRTGWEVQKLLLEGNICQGLVAKGQKLEGKVIVATGGLSYPQTGSTGQGYQLAKQAGHQVRGFWPSGVGLLTRPNWGKTKAWQGVAWDKVSLTLTAPGFKKAEAEGAVIFTHFGLSGPAIFRLSRAAALYLTENPAMTLRLNFFPEDSQESLGQKLAQKAAQIPQKTAATCLKEFLPTRTIGAILAQAQIAPEQKAGTLDRVKWQKVAEVLQNLSFTIYQTRPLREAVVTVGGVEVKEINPRTLESRLVKNLYFAGEVLDLDAYTGGYNLQMAWATGWTAGQAAAQSESW